MKIAPARSAAYDILLRIQTAGAFSSVLLPHYEANLSPRDARLCHELVLGTLRRQIELDYIVDRFVGRRRIDPEVRIALRVALFQLRHLDRVPAYSAINESVSLVERAKKRSAKGLVNAVLRRYLREPFVFAYADVVERISIETSHPRPLVEKWIKELGESETEVLARANNEPAPQAFRLIKEADEEALSLVANSTASTSVAGCYLSSAADVMRRLAEKRIIYIQDEGSQMIAHAVEVSSKGPVLDVCASPGGKAGLIAARNQGIVVVAGDLHSHRVDFLRDNLRRQQTPGVCVLQHDAESGLSFADGSFAAVLVDAPCSGTGTIRRNPEIRYRLPGHFGALADKQLRILKNASKVVSQGGLLVYSTCSLEQEENEEICRRFLAGSLGFELVPPHTPARFHTGAGFARTWPHRDGMDGFFIAAFRRFSL